jgi:hypothetical protein
LLHGIEKALNSDALIRGQIKSITELKNMTGAGISIEFGGKRQAHATSGSKIVDLLLRQRLDRARLKARVGLTGLRAGCIAPNDKCGCKQEKASHESGSMISARFVDRSPPALSPYLPGRFASWQQR